MISNELRKEMKEIKLKLPGNKMPDGIAELPTGVKTTSFLALSKLNSNTLMQRAESKKLDRETFRLLLIYKLTPYFGFIPLALANLSPTGSQVWPVVNRIYGKDTPNPVDFQLLHSSYKNLKQTIKSEKEVIIGSGNVLLTDTFKNFKKQIVENIKTGVQILNERSEKLDQQKSQALKQCIETLKNDFVRSRDKGVKSVFYALKLFKNTIPVSPSPFIEKRYLDLFVQTSKLKQLLDDIISPDGQSGATNSIETFSKPDNQIGTKDNTETSTARRKRRNSFSAAINKWTNAGDSSTRRKRGLSLDSAINRLTDADDSATRRKRGHSLSRLGNMVIGRHRISALVGETLEKINEKKKTELLNEDAKAFLKGQSSHFDNVLKTLTSKKNVSLVVETTIGEHDAKTKETKKITKIFTYKIELPKTFEEFQEVYSDTLKKANELVNNINVAGKKVRDDFLESTCKSNGIDTHDEQVRIQVNSIYSEVIADDPTITTGKRLAQIIKEPDGILEDSKGMYKHAFYTLKLFREGDIKEASIPAGCGITSTIGAFKLPSEFERILKEGTIAKDYSFSEETKEKLREKIAKLWGETAKPPSHLPPEAIKPLDAPIQKDAVVLPDETPIKQDTKTPPPHLPPEAIKPLDAPTPNLDELIGDIGPAPEMKPVVDVGSSTPPSHLPPEAIKPLDAPIQKDAVVLPGETPIK